MPFTVYPGTDLREVVKTPSIIPRDRGMIWRGFLVPRGFALGAGTARRRLPACSAHAKSKASDGVSGSEEKGKGCSSPSSSCPRVPAEPSSPCRVLVGCFEDAAPGGLTSACIPVMQAGMEANDAFGCKVHSRLSLTPSPSPSSLPDLFVLAPCAWLLFGHWFSPHFLMACTEFPKF